MSVKCALCCAHAWTTFPSPVGCGLWPCMDPNPCMHALAQVVQPATAWPESRCGVYVSSTYMEPFSRHGRRQCFITNTQRLRGSILNSKDMHRSLAPIRHSQYVHALNEGTTKRCDMICVRVSYIQIQFGGRCSYRSLFVPSPSRPNNCLCL